MYPFYSLKNSDDIIIRGKNRAASYLTYSVSAFFSYSSVFAVGQGALAPYKGEWGLPRIKSVFKRSMHSALYLKSTFSVLKQIVFITFIG